MRRFRESDKSVFVLKDQGQSGRFIGSTSDPKHCGSKGFTARTAAELLEKDDDSVGSKHRLSDYQRDLFARVAGDRYKKRDPYEMRSSETKDDYIRRINVLMGNT